MTDTAPAPAAIGDCREVGAGEAAAVLAVLDEDRFVTTPAMEKVATSGVLSGADGLFLTRGGPEHSLVFVGGSVLPIRGHPGDHRVLGRAVASLGTGPRSVHGRRSDVAALWGGLERYWGAPRQYRDSQQLMALTTLVDPGLTLPGVRRATLEEFHLVLPAAAAMYREELDADPFAVGAGVPFRRRVARSLSRGRTWVGIEGGEVVYKADIAAESSAVAQIQGVWVRPGRRSAGLGARGTAAVCADLRSRGLTPTLVVNKSNEAAVRAYQRVGLHFVMAYATVLTH